MPPDRSKVLVFLAAYNGSQWIEEQLASILNQTGVDVRVIVSDDGSKDDTREKILRFPSDRVTLTTPLQGSGSAAQNFLSMIRSHDAQGFDAVAFSDQDDLWHSTKLVRACNALRAKGVAGYSSAVTAVWPDGRRRVARQAQTPTQSDFLFEGAGQGCTFALAADFYKRARQFVLENEALTREVHYHDWMIYALARAWKLTWSFDPESSMEYRQHSGNDTGARYSIAGITKRLALIRSGWYRKQLDAIVDVSRRASPADSVIEGWYTLLHSPSGLGKRIRIVKFCLQGGRRKKMDNSIVMSAALAGWI